MFKSKLKITRQTGNDGTKNVEIMSSLKYLSNFWRTLKMLLITCEISLMLNWSKNVFSRWCSSNSNAKIYNNWQKLYVPVVTLSTQVNVKLLKQLELDFKRTINWNKYQSKLKTQALNRYLGFLIDPIFQGAKRFFVLLFENENVRESYKRYFLPKVEIKDYSVMTDGRNSFDEPIKMIKWHMITFKRLHLLKEMIKQLIIY